MSDETKAGDPVEETKLLGAVEVLAVEVRVTLSAEELHMGHMSQTRKATGAAVSEQYGWTGAKVTPLTGAMRDGTAKLRVERYEKEER